MTQKSKVMPNQCNKLWATKEDGYQGFKTDSKRVSRR